MESVTSGQADPEQPTVGGSYYIAIDPSAFGPLAAMLQRLQSEVGEAAGVLARSEYAEDAASFLEAIGRHREMIAVHDLTGDGGRTRDEDTTLHLVGWVQTHRSGNALGPPGSAGTIRGIGCYNLRCTFGA